MTEKIFRAYEELLRLEALSAIHEKLVPAMRAAEAEVIRMVMDRGGSVNLSAIGRDLTLVAHHCHIAGVHHGSWITATGPDHPAVVRTADIHAVGHRVAWKRSVNLSEFATALATLRKAKPRVAA